MSLLIVGAGATGLTAAYIAAKNGEDVTLLESSSSLGGLLSTFEVGGTQLECFYHHFFTHDREIRWLLKELSLDNDVRFVETKMGIYSKGKLFPFTTAKDLFNFPHLNLIDKLRFGLTSIFLSRQKNWRQYENIAALDWFYRWAGKRATEIIWYPMLAIKFGEYADSIPVSWMIGRMQQRLKSRSQGKEKLGYLQGSLQRLVNALEIRLEDLGVKILKNTSVEALIFDSHGRVLGAKTSNGDFKADKTLITIPTVYFSKLLPEIYDEYRKSLEKIEYFGAICAVIISQNPLSTTYWLNVADRGFEFGGIIEQTNFVPPEEYQGLHVTYLSRYTTLQNQLFHKSDEEISNLFKHQLRSIFPDLESAIIQEIKIFRTKTAATVCNLNFSQKIPSYKTPIPSLYIANMCHIYPDERSINNSIKVAFEVNNIMKMN